MVIDAATQEEIGLAGVPLSRYGGEANRFLVAATEMNTKEEMDRMAAALADSR